MKTLSALLLLLLLCFPAVAWAEPSAPAPAKPSAPAPASQSQAPAAATKPSAAPGQMTAAAAPQAQPSEAKQAQQPQIKPAQPQVKLAQPQQTRTKSAPSQPAAAANPSTASVAPDGGQFLVKLRDLQARVNELKEQIRRSHARLSLLSDTILSGGVNAARVEIKFQNEMSAAFRVTRVLVVLDGAVQFNKADEGESLAAQRQIPVFKGTIAPGDHTLQVSIKLRGHGYGVFSYLRGYTFDLKDELSFSVDEGKTIEISATAWEKGGTTTALEERPALRFATKQPTGIEEEANKPKVSKGAAQVTPKAPSVGAGAH
jgi:hypothetical protein